MIPQPLVPGDDGGADPAVAAALAAFGAGTGDAGPVLSALRRSRLLVPVVALLTSAEIGPDGRKREKESEMALPKLVGADGREAVLAFTSADSLARWRPDARPIQVSATQVGHAAAGEGASAVVIDIAGPVPFVVEDLRALAGGLHDDPEVLAALETAVADLPGIVTVEVGPSDAADLTLTLKAAPGHDPAELGRNLADRIGRLLPTGLELRLAR
ncbi:SseB family protein [Rhizohabitans arisaemae]|uniref:SseB family protein n=1 Tax=Rhizohabitans arisaemae TaxID=2720610 RepID=UPI0024B0B31F|nr:SseB family protein [Rhizohabitans arisaemae]